MRLDGGHSPGGRVGVWLGWCMRCMVTTRKLLSLVSGPVWGGIGNDTGQWSVARPVGGAHHPSVQSRAGGRDCQSH